MYIDVYSKWMYIVYLYTVIHNHRNYMHIVLQCVTHLWYLHTQATLRLREGSEKGSLSCQLVYMLCHAVSCRPLLSLACASCKACSQRWKEVFCPRQSLPPHDIFCNGRDRDWNWQAGWGHIRPWKIYSLLGSFGYWHLSGRWRNHAHFQKPFGWCLQHPHVC